MTKFLYLKTNDSTNKMYCDRTNIQIKPFRKHDGVEGKDLILNKFNIGAKVQRLKGNFGIGDIVIVNYDIVKCYYTLHITHSKYNSRIGKPIVVYAEESEIKIYETI